jgi:hypothetical protein
MENANRLADERSKELEAIGVTIPTEAKAEEKVDEEKKPDEKEEVTETKDTAPKEESDRPDDTDEDESEDEETESEETKEDEESDEDESEEEPTHVSPKDFKEMKRTFKTQIKELEGKLKEATSKKETTEAVADFDKFVEEKAKKLNLKPEVLKELNEITDKLVEHKLGAKLKDLDAMKQAHEATVVKEAEKQQLEIFNTEWTIAEKELKTQYPNATPEQVAETKKLMDDLAHSKKYHKYPMDFIVFKEREKIDKILFSPNKKSFETGKNNPNDRGEDTLSELPAEPTPAQIEAYERNRRNIMGNANDERMTLTSRDDNGNVIQREV